MLIKLNLEGELLELLKKDAEINCRTNPQQILYYLKQIYNGQLSISNNTQVVQVEVPTMNQEVPTETLDNHIETIYDQGDTNVASQEISNVSYIDDDIMNF